MSRGSPPSVRRSSWPGVTRCGGRARGVGGTRWAAAGVDEEKLVGVFRNAEALAWAEVKIPASKLRGFQDVHQTNAVARSGGFFLVPISRTDDLCGDRIPTDPHKIAVLPTADPPELATQIAGKRAKSSRAEIL